MRTNEEFNWDENDDRLSAMEDLVLSIFEISCVHETNNEVTKLLKSEIPVYYPKLLHDFYRKCAPKKLIVGGCTFFPYNQAFLLANEMKGEVLPIAYADGFSLSNNPFFEKLIYIDKNVNGVGYDSRIQMPIGKGKVQILGDNIFLFINSISASFTKS